MSLPFASQGDSVSYLFHGRRIYHWGAVTIDTGTISIPAPGPRTASLASLGLTAGGGIATTLTRSGSRPFAAGEIAVRLRPRRWGATGAASFFARPDYEFGLSYLLGTQPYRPIHTSDFAADDRAKSVPYNRFTLTTSLLWPFFSILRGGPSIGAGLGYPLFADDDTKVGNVRGFFVVGVKLHYEVTPLFSLTVNNRWFLGERLYRFTSTDFWSTPERSSSDLKWMLVDLGLQIWL